MVPEKNWDHAMATLRGKRQRASMQSKGGRFVNG
jgi:hypothetical protein